MKRFFKICLGVLLLVFVLFQFYPRSGYNLASGMSPNDITRTHYLPDSVQKILKTSCYDCHSSNTDYPWYAKIQPVSLWLADHIKEGKAELNFSEFGAYSLRRQFHKLEEINKQVKTGEMPLISYTLIHQYAKLNSRQKLLIANWTVALQDSFKINYPADSLKRKR